MSRRSASSNLLSSPVGSTGVGQTPPRTHIMAAKAAGNKADQIQDAFRRNLANPIAPITAGGMKAVARVLMARNQELKHLAAHVATSNVQAPPNGAFFWSGNNIAPGKEASAMHTAQHIAKRVGGKTVEQTAGGKALDEYAGHRDSFEYITARFDHMRSSQRRDLMKKGATEAGVNIPPPGRRSKNAVPHPMAGLSKGRAGGALWNVISARFAEAAVGEAQVIHAAPKSDSYFSSPAYTGSTFKLIEEPTLRGKGIPFKEHFGEHLTADLQTKPADHRPQYQGTGGRRAPGVNSMGNHSSSGTMAREGIFPASAEPAGAQRGTRTMDYHPVAHPRPWR